VESGVYYLNTDIPLLFLTYLSVTKSERPKTDDCSCNAIPTKK